MTADQLQTIRDAITGLLYPSESDEPFEIFQWSPVSGDGRDQVVAHAAGEPVVAKGVSAFFDDLKDSDDAAGFAALRLALENVLPGLSVFRVGQSPEVGVFLIGQLPDGNWAGVRTLAVET
jgi:hypothetical protein